MNIQNEYRKCSERLIEQTAIFPTPHQNLSYWHLPMPAQQTLFESEFMSSERQRECSQLLIDQAHHLVQIAPKSLKEVRVVVGIKPASLWDSQIIVFFGPDYFNKFFNRNSISQRWSKINGQSLIRDWNLKCPSTFSECGFDETIEDESYNGQIWLIGQLD